MNYRFTMFENREACRLCLSKSDLLYTLLDSELRRQVEICIGMQLDLTNDLPHGICFMCKLRAGYFFEFRHNCLRVQTELCLQTTPRPPIDITASGSDQNIAGDHKDQSTSHTDSCVIRTAVGRKKTEQVCARRKRWIPPVPLDYKALYRSQQLPCDICGKMIARNMMDGHRNKHAGLRPYLCSAKECTQTFHCKHLSRVHYRTTHCNEPYPCAICGKICRSSKMLYQHKREVHRECRFSCLVCGKLFVTNARLNTHKVIHSEERKFNCALCPKAFFRIGQLKAHSKTHTKEKNFKCNLCPKAYGYSHILRNHLSKVHGTESVSQLTMIH